MRQFDFHRNPGRHAGSVPYLVIIQSRFLAGHRQRVAVPLIRTGSDDKVLTPHVVRLDCLGEELWFDPMLVQSVPAARIGPALVNLEAQGDAIINAIDGMISRA